MSRNMGSSYQISNFRLLASLILILFLGLINNAMSKPEESQTYIIHMDPSFKPATFSTHESWHRSTLNSLSSSSSAEADKNMFLYSYQHAMHGFSAKLTPSQLAEIEKSPAHLSTYQESFGKMYTTYSSKFLGLKRNFGLWPAAAYGDGVIIGVIDTGIWPESESFNDKGMSPVPERWKGECENGTEFSYSLCNRKLIGARSFSKGLIAANRSIEKRHDYDSARDFRGHGTHTSSTAAGNYVLGVSHFGYARGTARGVAPAAHVAMYKVLFSTDTNESAASDVLAGMDQAIADGVDIMSISLGFNQTSYYNDVIAIAALSATEKGISIVCATGNDRGHNTTHNAAPWITTVGAGTIDRSFVGTITLGNGLTMEGTSYFPESVYITDVLFYYGGDNISKAMCRSGALDRHEVARKVVFCDNPTETDIATQIKELVRVHAYAGIFMSDLIMVGPKSNFNIPILLLPKSVATLVLEYVKENINATVKTMKFVSTRLGSKPAPQVAFFSSRGPDPITPSLLKPDILAPGVHILAAVAPNVPLFVVGSYNLATDYALFSGTSMAAPHVAGVTALLKAVHRDWSPAAIRSAIMTTAYTIDNEHEPIRDEWTGLPATPLDFGAGHINPNKALNPGLIYDANMQDYTDFLCGLGYTSKQMSAVLRKNQWACSENNFEGQLNYPSFVVVVPEGVSASTPMVKNFSRVVTNMEDDGGVYQAFFQVPDGMRIRTEPSSLKFSKKNEKHNFEVIVEINRQPQPVIYGFLKWVDQYNHVVSSPVVAFSIGHY